MIKYDNFSLTINVDDLHLCKAFIPICSKPTRDSVSAGIIIQEARVFCRVGSA